MNSRPDVAENSDDHDEVRRGLWAMLEAADRQIERGEYVEWNEETKRTIWEEAVNDLEREETFDPDVIPTD
jgi:hypothetical protein